MQIRIQQLLTQSQAGADASSFAVNQASGVLTLKAKPDFESPAMLIQIIYIT